MLTIPTKNVTLFTDDKFYGKDYGKSRRKMFYLGS